MGSGADDTSHKLSTSPEVGRLLYRLPSGKKGPKYVRVQSVEASGSRLRDVVCVLEDQSRVKADDEGNKWAWAVEAHTAGMLVSISSTCDSANLAMLSHLCRSAFGGLLPDSAQEAILRCLQGGVTRIDSQGSVIRIVDGWVAVTVDLPCVDRYSCGMEILSSCCVGPNGDCLYLFATEVLRPGVLGSANARRVFLFELKLPLCAGSEPKRLCEFNIEEFNMLPDGLWFSGGVILLGEREASGNVAQLRRWDGSLTWEVRGRSLPGFDWLDRVYPYGDKFLMIGTSYQAPHTDGRKLFLCWDPMTRTAEVWLPGATLLAMSKERFPNEPQFLSDIVFGPHSTLIYAARGEDEGDKRVSVLWHCTWPSLEVICKTELDDFSITSLRHVPDGRLLASQSDDCMIWLDFPSLRTSSREDYAMLDGKNEPEHVGHDPTRTHVSGRSKYIHLIK